MENPKIDPELRADLACGLRPDIALAAWQVRIASERVAQTIDQCLRTLEVLKDLDRRVQRDREMSTRENSPLED